MSSFAEGSLWYAFKCAVSAISRSNSLSVKLSLNAASFSASSASCFAFKPRSGSIFTMDTWVLSII